MSADQYKVTIYREASGGQPARVIESKVVDARDREATSRNLRREYEKVFGGKLVVKSMPFSGSITDITTERKRRNRRDDFRRPPVYKKPAIPVYFEVVR